MSSPSNVADSARTEPLPALEVETLLGLTTLDQQTTWLRQHHLLNHAGLTRLLDEAEQAVGRDPGQARRLAQLGDALTPMVAESADLRADLRADLHARATYIHAQTHYRNAEFDDALRLIRVAHEVYQAIGNPFEALRVNLGGIAVLSEQGNYDAALEIGRALIEQAAMLQPDTRHEITADDIAELSAKAYLNCGACYELKGDYDAALQAFAEAEARYATLGLDELTADIQLNRGVVLLKLGQGESALAAFEEAHRRFSTAGLTLKDAWALINAADAHLMLGQYTQSLQRFAEARRNIEPLEASADKHVLLLDAADAYLDLNLFTEAGNAYRDAIAALRASGMTHDLARAQLGLGTALMALRNMAAAEPILNEAETVFQHAGNVAMQVQVQLQQAALQRHLGKLTGARHIAQQALTLASQGAWPLQQVTAHLVLAELWLLDERPDIAPGITPSMAQAELHLAAAQPLAQQLDLPGIWVRLHTLLGHMSLLQGAWARAEFHLQAAVREIETLRSTLASDRIRASFVDSRLSAYEDLVELYLGQQTEQHMELPVEQAFNMVERAKSRALVDRLNGELSQSHLDAPTTQHLRQLQRALEECYSDLMSAATQNDESSDEADASMPDVQALQAQALVLEQEINQLELTASASASESFDEIGDAPDSGPAIRLDSVLDAKSICAQLPADATLISYTSRNDEIIAFVAHAEGVDVVRGVGHISAVQVQLRQLDVQWQRVQANPQAVARHLPQLTRSAQAVLRALFTELVEPLLPLLRPRAGEARPLVIVPHGPLHHVPFHALFDGARYLSDDFEISYAPSATVFAQCQQRPTSTQEHALVVGVADPLIPSAVVEAEAVAQTLGHATLLTDEHATATAVQTHAPTSRVVHLACHGLFRADNPMFSSLRLHDGWLMAADIARLDLRGACVVYSACESGRNQVSRGDEVYGLVRAALSAGAVSVVASLWLVHDQTTATLMQAWYARLQQGMQPARALREAQRAVRETQPHPYFWAPFALIGKR